MKATEIIDSVLECANQSIVVELPNGVRMVTTGYAYGENKRGEPILIIKAGRKLTT